MCSAFRSILVGVAVTLLAVTHAAARELRVCADPNNLPFSNARLEGFENKIVEVLARELNAEVHYTWWAQRRGFIRNTLNADLCDLIAGTVKMDMLQTTAPYYRSSYVFVTRTDQRRVESFDDPALRSLKIGVQLIGDDGFNTPPAHALSQRGIIDNVRGYSIYGDYRDANPPAAIISAVASGEIDVAVVWGPFAAYFVRHQSTPLHIESVTRGGREFRMAFDVVMGMRRNDTTLLKDVSVALERRRGEIDEILATFGVPRLDRPQQGTN